MGADIVIAIDLSKDIIDHRFKKQKKRSKENIDQKLYSEIYFKNIENPIVQKLTKHLTKAEKVVFEKVGSWKKTKIELPNIFETFSTSIDIMETQIAKANFQISKPDVIIRPKLSDLNFFDFNLGKKAIDEGYKRTMGKMEEIKSLINQ
jgi:predicted acylesterase/phospholipase RssA